MAKTKKRFLKGWQVAPLKGSFMVMAIIGFLASAYYLTNVNYRFSFMFLFVLMFIASLISMTKAPVR